MIGVFQKKMLILMILVNRFLFLIPILFTLFFSCNSNKKTYKILGYAQGTTYQIKYHHIYEIDKFEIDSLLVLVDNSMSTYLDNSIISLINQGKEVYLDSLITTVINKSLLICNETDGMFDITVAPIVNHWGFGPDKMKKKNLDSLSHPFFLVGCDKIFISNGQIVKSDSVSIDLNGIAQGFSVDFISNYLRRQHGIQDFMVEVGGELRCEGNNLGNGWKIGIDAPTDLRSGFSFVVKLRDISLATSGSYRNYYYLDTIKINHTMNPKTLQPAQNKLISATILYSDCMSADAYATACMSFGFERAKKFLNDKEISGCLIYVDDGDTLSYLSSKFSSFLH